MVLRGWILAGGVMGALAVLAAAYAAHATVEPGRVRAVSSAVQMQGWHALALVACGLVGTGGGWWVQGAGWLFLVGTVLFAGAVWLPLFGGPGLGMVAPVGGIMLMVGWVALGVGGWLS